jgi:hypothetical protein
MGSTCISKDCFYKESEMEPYATWKLLSILAIGSFVAGVLWARQMQSRQRDLNASRRKLPRVHKTHREEQLQSPAEGDLQRQ